MVAGDTSTTPERLGAFCNGSEVACDGPTTELLRPEDGLPVARMVEGGAAAVDCAVAAASAAFREHRKSSLRRRATWLSAMATGLREHAEMLATIVSEDVGKPIRAAGFESRRGAEFLDSCAAATLDISGEVVPVDAADAGAGCFGFTRRIPYGVVGAITPFNAPINLLIQKVGPALAAGNAVVVKPAPAGTRSALALARICTAAGLPAGLFNVVTGAAETATALAAHREVDAVTFTGGTEAGDALARAAGAKKFVAELGSNAANVVMADADIADAARKIARAAFEASGQQCISAQRVLVERPVFDAFAEQFVAFAAAMRVGAPGNPETDIGPMVHAAAAERIMAMLEDARAHGARTLLQERKDGATVSPAILADVPKEARLWREEAFGPVAILTPFDGVEEALALANDSPFGLQGAVFTASLSTAMRFSTDFEVGSLWINQPSRFRLDMYPFGGVKRSGTGREGVRYAIEELSQIRFTGISLPEFA